MRGAENSSDEVVVFVVVNIKLRTLPAFFIVPLNTTPGGEFGSVRCT